MVIWLTGLSGSGKSTIGRSLFDLWKAEAPNTVIVDGDDIRQLLKIDGENHYTLEARKEVAERIAGICAWLDGQEINVVCCTISLFGDLHERNRRTLSRYFEVFVSVPMDVLERRDTKNLYGPARRGEIRDVVGVDLPFSPPEQPDMVIDNRRDGIDLAAVAADILRRAMAS
jgi:cytidine diphosphoramidate kinase